jgi:hypothetical protein
VSSIDHRNIAKKKNCPKCDHFHGVAASNVPGASGMCLKDPPKVFVVGMAPSASSVIKGENPDLVPILRAFYPPVGPSETCSQWTPRAEGEA